jgi:hypothetical protein
MILPTKHVSLEKSLLGAGGFLLSLVDEPSTATRLWERAKEASTIESYGRFILVLDLLYAVGSIDLVDGLIVKSERL